MRRTRFQIGLSLILGLGLVPGLWAQGPAVPGTVVIPQPAPILAMPVPTVQPGNVGMPHSPTSLAAQMAAYPVEPLAPPPTKKVGFLKKCGLNCWSHINNVGCGSLHSELTFAFGSCRTFYGEPCLDGPPEAQKKKNGQGQAGCNCR